MNRKTYKGYTVKVVYLTDYDEYDAFGKRPDGKTVFQTHGWKTEKEALEKLIEAIDRAENEQQSDRVPGLGAFRDWSGVNIERRKK